MTTADSPSYEQLPERLQQLAEKLRGCDDPDVANDIAAFIDWNDEFHRRGLKRLIEMIEAWRGEIFLEAVLRDPIAATYLKTYRLPQ